MKKIAVVEDNADNRLVLKAILEEMYDIAEYESGTKALDSFKDNRPDLILLDISLPEVDGLQILKAIRSSRELKEIPVIAFTAHAMVGDRERFLTAGFDNYLSKPILDDKIVVNTIETLLTHPQPKLRD